ncbi:MAG: prepilin-type N-terminal cleavage/methylation domain-containing protein [Planctomycetes bacterium]|nr:prepilin-type N-terminal cleavage/methylation domain-containing protein [Planctomycetota bacterium]
MLLHDRNAPAFTLLELLITIAIVILISGLLFPAISNALAKSRQMTCLNNTRGMIMAWLEWGNRRSSASIAGESSALCLRAQNKQGQTWVKVLSDSIPPESFKCPEQENPATEAYGYGLNPLCGGVWYYTSGELYSGFLLTPEHPSLPLYNGIINPAHTVVLCESGYITDASIELSPVNWKEDSTKPWVPYVAFSLTGPAPYTRNIAPSYGYDWGNDSPVSGIGEMGWNHHYRAVPRHPKVTTGFADGHVESIEIGLLTKPQWGTPGCLYDNQPPFPKN